ncbi:hypothetical protein AMAG_14590 [Allomyces macrogynus ATCC 38327]|uniref:Tubulin-specific chaperone A n=1 Tax=Allomyces macrogynus (strain ATCC 38327) TaxID=578462 RepID=A0A0L0T6W3_ALLM3|nr:hypothetical protein GGF31_005270 [Allomyces arbusculus]KNE70462.1 hypothetical protein AMAG_14590 [Allomyces macrogynus ATCC 38327]|eukprot:KNE70462.1 hypothetical protein AMAG_14590 [Allomyces macrogynus ATCC 38327]
MSAIRDLKIKTGVVKRVHKETFMYQKEAEQQQARIQKLIDSGADEHDVRKQKEVLQETLVMIPDTQRRLAAAFHELEGAVDALSKFPDVQGTPELEAAQAILAEARPQIAAE